ncbi:response regulator [Salegentibacter sp. JZCK2]|uniref:response regulator n=1 Tax=Salegentibacter tibetensis TaxID=2873600 RepID=UPI001CC9B008|nr:response regulator [Salegentibacter tibetensis]MBZ9731370.1 response regulator [Salegentibacter tibetensis]
MKTKYLFIDDDQITTLINKRIFQKEFPEENTYDFSSASLALNFLNENGNRKNLLFIIFLDINMPEINGWEFMEILEKDFSHLNIIIHLLTSSIDQNDQKKAQGYKSVDSYILKPLNRFKLLELDLKSETYAG